MKIDSTDLEIMRLLQGNGRLTHEQIAREIHLSRPAVHERVRRLEDAGVIRGYAARVDWEAIGLPLTAFVWVRTSLSCLTCLATSQEIIGLSLKTALVEECHRVTGEWCLLVKTHSASTLALQELLDAISSVNGVQNIMTTVVLSTISDGLQPKTPKACAFPQAKEAPLQANTGATLATQNGGRR